MASWHPSNIVTPENLQVSQEPHPESSGSSSAQSSEVTSIEIEDATFASRICGPVDVPLTVQFFDVRYKIKTSRPKWNSLRKNEKEILRGVSGQMLPGQLTALMGPSGSGKTCLLSAIGNRISNTKAISGEILFNGRPASRKLRKNIAFVLQDDVLFPHLTVRETLTYAALLKLPRRLSRAQKLQTVENVIKQLHLERCADSKVGGAMVRGISGGERKRTSIAVELLINPSLLLMDEPTSGLDSTMALTLIRLLKEIAVRENRTIICAIHQPSSKIFFLFHQLMLLVDGQIAYRGDLRNVVQYFADRGFTAPSHENPADYIMSLMTERQDVVQQLIQATTADNKTLQRIDYHGPEFENQASYETTLIEQMLILTRRSFKQFFFTIFNGPNLGQAFGSSIVAGLLWLQIPYLETNVNDRYGLVFFLTVLWSFTPFNISINSFPVEQGIIRKEHASSYYSLIAYMAAKALTEMPLIAILPVIASTATYFMAHLQYTFLSWFETELLLVLITWTMQGLAFLIGVLVGDFAQAVGIGTAIILLSMLVGGFFIQNIPIWLIWTRYLSIIYYGVSLFAAIQFNPTTVFGCNAEPPVYPSCVAGEATFPGTEQLQKIGNYNVWGLNLGVLLGVLVACRVFSYFALRRQLR